MTLISKRRLASLVSASASIATVAVAAAPAATFAARRHSLSGSWPARSCTSLPPSHGTVTGDDRRDRLRHRCLHGPGHAVTDADISGANYYGVVVNGVRSVNVTSSQIHDIGENPFNGAQHGHAIFYINGASGTISGNKVSDFQKNGIKVSGMTADDIALSTVKTSATVQNNIVTGHGRIDYIAQNGILIRNGASATVMKNTVSGFNYTPTPTRPVAYSSGRPGAVNVQKNAITGNEANIYIEGTTKGHVKP